MRALLVSIIVSVTAGGSLWHACFDPGDYTELTVVTECKGAVPFYVYDSVPLTELGQEEADARRQLVPKDETCTVQFSLRREDDSIAESVIVLQEG